MPSMQKSFFMILCEGQGLFQKKKRIHHRHVYGHRLHTTWQAIHQTKRLSRVAKNQ